MMASSLFHTLPDLIGSIGQPHFYHQVGVSFNGIPTVSNFKIFSYPKAEKPALLAGSCEPEYDQIYCDYAYLMDPFYEEIQKQTRHELVTLDSITRHDFQSSTYYDRFYRKIGWKNEANLIVSLNDERTICLAYTAKEAPINELNCALRPYLESIKAAIQKHEDLLSFVAQHTLSHSEPLIIEQSHAPLSLEEQLSVYGLTKRETEVVSFILQGLASSAIADLCFVSEGTIKNHRKNIYRKLNIRSQAELFRKFLK